MHPVKYGGLLLIGLAVKLRAGTLPAPVTVAECTDFTVVDDPVTCSLSSRDAFASGSLTLSPFVGLTAQASSSPINGLFNPGAGAFVSVKYSFQVVGGNPNDIVPILIATNLTSSASSFSHAYGFAETVVHTGFGDGSVVVCTNGTCGTTNTSFFEMFAWNAFSGETGDPTGDRGQLRRQPAFGIRQRVGRSLHLHRSLFRRGQQLQHCGQFRRRQRPVSGT